MHDKGISRGTHLFPDSFSDASQTMHQSFRFAFRFCIFRFLAAARLLVTVAACGCVAVACSAFSL